jgi:RNA polymerase sigma factor (sigma-70 family)
VLGDTDATAIRRSPTDPQAFRAVFERHFDAVHRFAQRRVGRELADEVAAETFARAFDRRARYDLRRDDARPWLLGIASNLARRHWRDERRRLIAYGRAADDPAGRERAEHGLSAQVEKALDGLAAADREALLLLAWGDLTYEEIAVALRVPVGTVRSRIFRARRQMRDRLRLAEHLPDRLLEEACDVRP